MTIHDFDRYIDKMILQRGQQYYGNGYVENLEQMEVGEFHALVVGSEDYDVYVKLNAKHEIIESSCSCPYNWGDVCKHEAAVYYEIRDKRMYQKGISKEASELMYQVDQMKEDELKTYLYNLLKRNRQLRAEFLGKEEID